LKTHYYSIDKYDSHTETQHFEQTWLFSGTNVMTYSTIQFRWCPIAIKIWIERICKNYYTGYPREIRSQRSLRVALI